MKVLLFAQLEEIVGEREIEIKSEPMTVGQLKDVLLEKYPNLRSLDSTIVAVNEEYVKNDTQLKENDVVALIPPVSGG
ncbi:molybdopterin converting factor subunit 1 [Alkalihalobacterium chitinilyticum]|uniref:Molybdopterin synthase sulfur carrier subunit n=1 Tax=Alkalihalobacterium chitinilyticum TaxID=2980103 RepID=A0ABT5VKE0_9BACI|nr:molybdopterin converting factor subunit 1 [Alkalihalobacterium chitinilyticum]MDE5415928.1 molybdopterin converting factor subunit 1 [Alkalihalobacterium chitinilyticum]